jgi:hypothetical protein
VIFIITKKIMQRKKKDRTSAAKQVPEWALFKGKRGLET